MHDGDVDVFLALVERHRTYMYNLALRLTGREQDAKDVVQDSLFGPTQCRSLYYCRSCRQPFEALKSV